MKLTSIKVKVDITHSYRGDLLVTLTSPAGKKVVLHNRAGGGDDNVKTTFDVASVPALKSLYEEDIQGDWELHVQDQAGSDVGTLNSWEMDVEGKTSGLVELEEFPSARIPDNDSAGIVRTLESADAGILSDIEITVDITHTYIQDLVVALTSAAGTQVDLHRNTGSDADDITKTFSPVTTPGLRRMFDEQIRGNWKLKVADTAGNDIGKLNGWRLRLIKNNKPQFITTALEFDGQDDWVQSGYLLKKLLPHLNAANRSNATLVASIEAWINVSRLPSPQDDAKAVPEERNNILHLGQSSGGEYSWTLNHDGSVVLGINMCGSQETSVEVGEWTHLACVHDGQTWVVYKNGEPVAAPKRFSAKGWVAGGRDAVLVLGRSFNGSFLNGQLAEVRVWNKARTKEEIQADLYRQLTGNEEGLASYYRQVVDGRAKDLMNPGGVGYTKGGLVSVQASIPRRSA